MTHPGQDPGRPLRDRAARQQERGTVTGICPSCGDPVGLNRGSAVAHRHEGSPCPGRGRLSLSGRAVQPIPGGDEVAARRRGNWARRVIVPRALDLVTAVRDEDRAGIGERLGGLGVVELQALAVTLAAMVPEDRPVAHLLAWVDRFDDTGRAVDGDGRERVAA